MCASFICLNILVSGLAAFTYVIIILRNSFFHSNINNSIKIVQARSNTFGLGKNTGLRPSLVIGILNKYPFWGIVFDGNKASTHPTLNSNSS